MNNSGNKVCCSYPVAAAFQKVITQGFGETDLDYSKFGLKGHNGIDFGVPMNTVIYACGRGVVEKCTADPGYGNYIKIVHTWGVSIYAHLSCWMVKVGQEVNPGDVIGRSGSTGNSTGPHLHFEIRLTSEPKNNGYNGAVDPLPYFLGENLSVETVEAKPETPEPEQPTELEPAGLLMVNNEQMNIRSGPGVNYPIVGMLPQGSTVEALDVAGTNAWIQTSAGWVCSQLGNTKYMTAK